MNKNDDAEVKLFYVNPYPYKLTNGLRLAEDSKLLQEILNKSQDEIYEASKAYCKNGNGLRNFIFIARSYENLRRGELSHTATSLAVAIILFAIDALMTHISKVPRPKNYLRKGNRLRNITPSEYKLAEFLRKCLSKEDKLLLLDSFVFSARASKQIPMGKHTLRHLMYRSMLKKSKTPYFSFKKNWCTAQESIENTHCNCIGWLASQNICTVNHFLRALAVHLYKMRCSIVHDGTAPLIAHTEKKPEDVAVWGMSVFDVYFDNKHSRHFYYESGLSRMTLERVFKSALWVAFQKGFPRSV